MNWDRGQSPLRRSAPTSLLTGASVALGVLALLGVVMWLGFRSSRPVHASVAEDAPRRLARSQSARAAAADRSLEPTTTNTVTVAPDAPVSAPPTQPTDFEAWARQHPADALTWALHAPNGPERSVIAENICLRLAQTNPSTAVDLADALGADGYVLDNIVQQWADSDLTAARAYALSRPPSVDRDRLLSRIVLVESQTNPRAAAAWVAEDITSGETQQEAALTVLHQWARQDLRSAFAWVEQFPDDAFRRRALDELTRVIPANTP